MSPAQKFGDWGKAKSLLVGLGPKLQREIRKATIKNCLLLVREIRRGIRNQSPGGKAFAPLAQSTIDAKGSSKALIDTGFLINGITMRVIQNGGFVGVLRGRVGEDGVDRANVGAIMEYGATIPLANGGAIVIPARPFLGPTLAKLRPAIEKNYADAIALVLKSGK